MSAPAIEQLRNTAEWALSWRYLFGWSADVTLGPPVPKPSDFTQHVHRLATAVIDTLPLHEVAEEARAFHEQHCGCNWYAEGGCDLSAALARLDGEEAIAA